MIASTAEAAVAREPVPAERRTVRWRFPGGVEGSCVVARRTERWKEKFLFLGFDETKTALLCEALSLIIPIRSAKLVIFPIELKAFDFFMMMMMMKMDLLFVFVGIIKR